jgi:hypothetical protein
LVSGRALYDEVIVGGLMRARTSVWIATANVKELTAFETLGERERAAVSDAAARYATFLGLDGDVTFARRG